VEKVEKVEEAKSSIISDSDEASESDESYEQPDVLCFLSYCSSRARSVSGVALLFPVQ